jgi:putative two-component system response regulator
MCVFKIHKKFTKNLNELKRDIRNFVSDSESLLFSFARIAEKRAGFSKEHTKNIIRGTLQIAKELELSEKERLTLKKGTILRDIGMLGVPENILKKREKFTDEERRMIQNHTIFGFEICNGLSSVEDALPIIRHHHERWDGRGYPDGLSKERIPLLARIVAVVDSFYSLLSSRPYREALYMREALAVLVGGAGAQWDPAIVRIFFQTLRRGDEDIPRVSSLNIF